MGFETKTIRIAMNGITGRMGYRQHLLRSILPIRDNGGFTLEDGTKVQVEPIVVGRNEAKIRELAELHKVSEWTTDLDAVINDPTVDVVFDASSWNYRKEDGGGMTTDMFCHWNYVLEGIIGKVTSVNAKTATHIPTRWDETGKAYEATADYASYGIFELETPAGDPVIGQINSSWAVRVYRDELVEFQIDGTHGSAVAGLNKCVAQQRAHTPKPVWNPELPVTESFRSQWQEVPANAELDNGFKLQWEAFLRDVVAGREHRFGLLSAARGVQLAELGLQSNDERRTIDIPEITL